MTDEERQKLISTLRAYQGYDRELRKFVHQAADEIERLAKETERLNQVLDNYVEEKNDD